MSDAAAPKPQAETKASEKTGLAAMDLLTVDIAKSIQACEFPDNPVTRVYYPAADLFKAGKEDEGAAPDTREEEEAEDAEE